MKAFNLLTLTLLLVAGCSAFPGLQVLTGQDTTEGSVQNVAVIDLVMADKTGATNPSLSAAADRIEAASLNVDIIEIRRNEADDALEVNLLFQAPADADQTQAGLISYYTAIQRAFELTWQATMGESEGTGLLRVNFIVPQDIATLDSTSGRSYIGFVMVNSEIERQDAINYLSQPHTLNDFLDLIAGGTLVYEEPPTTQVYDGQPNHPLFMLADPNAATANDG